MTSHRLEVLLGRFMKLEALAKEAKAELEKEQKKVAEPFEYASYGIRHEDLKGD